MLRTCLTLQGRPAQFWPQAPSPPFGPSLTLGRAGVTGAKAMCIRSCPKQSLTAVEASSSQREGQGRGLWPARSSAGVSLESGVSVRKESGEGLHLSLEAPLPVCSSLLSRRSLLCPHWHCPSQLWSGCTCPPPAFLPACLGPLQRRGSEQGSGWRGVRRLVLDFI